MENLHQQYTELSLKTADNLRTMALSLTGGELSRLSLPEVEATVDKIARLVPAGNVPGLILNGLARLPGRQLPQNTVRRDINLLFKGVEKTLDAAVYSAFFAGPAAIIWGYQNLIKLSGKNPEDAFPEGPWQFYVDYSMREDSARHSNETYGFDAALNQSQIHLSAVDRITAWTLAAIHCLHQYPQLLANEWRERVYISLLQEIAPQQPEVATLYQAWEQHRPYALGPTAAASESYPAFRRRKFDEFLDKKMAGLPPEHLNQWQQQIHQAQAHGLPAYQQQMSILAYLEPGPYGETRTPIALEQAHVGVIHRESYYLIPASAPNSNQPPQPHTVRQQVAALLDDTPNRPNRLTGLAEIKRNCWPDLRKQLDPELVLAFNQLRLAPILLNCDAQPPRLPLAQLRRAERGLGDHALTIFDTGATFVFDQSHIFFDGGWGAALAEILTGAATRWAITLHQQAGNQPVGDTPPARLNFATSASDEKRLHQAPRVNAEAAAETEAVNLRAMQNLRRLFKQRNDLIRLTINDLLILYRAVHAATYSLDSALLAELTRLVGQTETGVAARAALEAIESANRLNPAIVIPVDGSQRQPRDRLYPFTFEVPLADLELLDLHRQALAALSDYQAADQNRGQAYGEFDRVQRLYLRNLAGFGELLDKAKAVAKAGESGSMEALKLMAHLPAPLQRLLDQVPDRFDVLNDLIKGREVFSNVGAVAPGSTLTRFISAKDDNDKKTLVWGVLTDASGVMRLTLRDFRPHVGLLAACGHQDLAQRLTRHYLEAYAHGFNDYIRELAQITRANRDTQLKRPEQNYVR